uniref:Uncharacterized protein n=1 Tax=Hippocampus comes TaxID=109280 RepID=A0A3Q2YB43_HIPCM
MIEWKHRKNTSSLVITSDKIFFILISVVAAILGSLQVGYHTGNVNAPAKVKRTHRLANGFSGTNDTLSTWRHRYNETMPDESLTLLWSLSVSIKDFGALLGCLGVKFVADNFGAVPVRLEESRRSCDWISVNITNISQMGKNFTFVSCSFTLCVRGSTSSVCEYLSEGRARPKSMLISC